MLYDIILVRNEGVKDLPSVSIIKMIRSVTGLGLKEAKTLLPHVKKDLPMVLQSNVPKPDLESYKDPELNRWWSANILVLPHRKKHDNEYIKTVMKMRSTT
jgi:hypothetical protein